MFISLDKWKRQKKVENNALNLMSLNCKHKNWETELTVLLKSKHHFTSYLWNVKATENYIGKLIQFSKLGIRSEKIWKLDRQRVKTKFKGAVLLNVSNNLLFALMVKFIENNYSLLINGYLPAVHCGFIFSRIRACYEGFELLFFEILSRK